MQCQSTEEKDTKYVRVVSVDGVFKLVARDRGQLVDSRLGQTKLVGALCQVERSNAVGTFLVCEILSTTIILNMS